MASRRGFDDMADAVGASASAALCEYFGGEAISVPRDGNRVGGSAVRARLVRVIGEKGAAAFCECFGGEVVYIPKASRPVAEALLDRGARPSEVARRLGVTVSYVRRIARDMRRAEGV